MADTIQLEIVTSTDPAIKASIKQLYIPAYLGKAGVLENHKPYISLLKPGEIFYTDIKDNNVYLYIQEGFMEVKDNKIVIISDSVEKGESLVLKKEEIEEKLTRVKNKINSYSKGEISLEELNAKIESSLKLKGMADELKPSLKEVIPGEELEEKVKSFLKGEVIKEALEESLEEQKEFEIKRKIIQKVEEKK